MSRTSSESALVQQNNNEYGFTETGSDNQEHRMVFNINRRYQYTYNDILLVWPGQLKKFFDYLLSGPSERDRDKIVCPILIPPHAITSQAKSGQIQSLSHFIETNKKEWAAKNEAAPVFLDSLALFLPYFNGSNNGPPHTSNSTSSSNPYSTFRLPSLSMEDGDVWRDDDLGSSNLYELMQGTAETPGNKRKGGEHKEEKKEKERKEKKSKRDESNNNFRDPFDGEGDGGPSFLPSPQGYKDTRKT